MTKYSLNVDDLRTGSMRFRVDEHVFLNFSLIETSRSVTLIIIIISANRAENNGATVVISSSFTEIFRFKDFLKF